MLGRLKSNWLIPGCVALVLLTLLAAVLQYHWINRVSDADRRLRHDFVATTLRNFSGDFRETILRLLPSFRLPPSERTDAAFESDLLALTRQWRSNADRPQLLSSVSIGRQSDKGITFKRLRLDDDQFKDATWPAEFALYRTILEHHLHLPVGAPPLFPPGIAFEFFQGRPVLIFPLVTGAPPPESQRQEGMSGQFPLNFEAMMGRPLLRQQPGARDPQKSPGPAPLAGTMHMPDLKGWCFLEINPDYLREHLLPELVARYYGPEARADYHVAIIGSQPLSIIYRSEPALTIESLSEVDGGIVLLEANMQQGRPGPPPPQDDSPSLNERHSSPPPPPPPGPQPFMSGAESTPLAQLDANRRSYEMAWMLVVKNKAGSLESLVEHSRRHNLAVSFAILMLLAGSTVMLTLATARARSLARQQMEFVAGVSHELRTPLTVIQSTSYNLSKGMIQDPGRVRQYGDVIQNEARRLIQQVERMLSFAGIQSGRRIYDPQPANAEEIVDRTLADYANAFADDGWQIEKRIEANLPLVLTDAPSLESALKNLFENALKYASQGKSLNVSTRAAGDKRLREVQITIADRGPGISPKDLPHIFEPFYRGQDVIASSTGGAGLGLCLVERQMRALGGRVTVQSSTNGGTSFTLHLPTVEQVSVAAADGSNSDDDKQDPGD